MQNNFMMMILHTS